MADAVRSSPRRLVIGVDLGGTKCHAALVDPAGTFVHEVYRRTSELPDPADLLIDTVAGLRRAALAAGQDVGGVGIGVPGFLDPGSGLVVGAWNLGWHGFDLCARLDEELSEPYVVENDVNLAAVGEARVGAGRGARSFVVMSLGTGLGGAVVIDGHVVRGAHGAAGEFGFLLPGRDQLGRPGVMAMEACVGGWALAERGAPDQADAAALFAAARRGDRPAVQVLEEFLEHVAMTVVDVVAVLDPERVIFDGSIGRALGPYLARLGELIAPSVLYVPELVVSALTPSAPLVGAVAEARDVSVRTGGGRRPR